MGTVACCKKPENEEEKNLERSKLYTSIKKFNNFKNTDLIILSEEPTTTKINYNNENNNNNIFNKSNEENLIKDEKVKKIQQKYRSYHLKNKFQTEIKPIISKKTNNPQMMILILMDGKNIILMMKDFFYTKKEILFKIK